MHVYIALIYVAILVFQVTLKLTPLVCISNLLYGQWFMHVCILLAYKHNIYIYTLNMSIKP